MRKSWGFIWILGCFVLLCSFYSLYFLLHAIDFMRRETTYTHFKKILDIPWWHLWRISNLLSFCISFIVWLRATWLLVRSHRNLLLLLDHLIIVLRGARLFLLIIWIWSIAPKEPVWFGSWRELLLLCHLLLLLLHHQLGGSRLLLLLLLWSIYKFIMNQRILLKNNCETWKPDEPPPLAYCYGYIIYWWWSYCDTLIRVLAP